MAQFDLYVNTDQNTNKVYPYFIDIQNDLLDSLNSRVVIPLTPLQQSDKSYPKNLCPVVEIEGKTVLDAPIHCGTKAERWNESIIVIIQRVFINAQCLLKEIHRFTVIAQPILCPSQVNQN